MDDNSIITKYELNEREKKLKSDFFKNKVNKNNLNVINDENNNDNIMNNINKISSQITEENLNKFIEDNQNLLNKSNINNNNNNNYEYNPTQLNLIYNQNKLIERNVDILQETQRSLHDFLIYNMRKDAQNKPSFNLNNLNEYLKPLYNNINDLKEQVKNLNNNNNNIQKNIQNSNSNLNENLKEDYSYKNNLNNNKINKNNINQIKPPLKSNKNNNKEKQVVKAISDLKSTMGNLSEEMNKLGNKFQEKLNKVMEDTEHNKLKNIIGAKNNNLNMSFGENKKDSFIKGKFLDNIDYNELKNELNDINFEKESIINDYEKNVPQMQKLQKPKEKIKFSYNLDYPTSVSSNKSQLNNTKSSVFSLDENQNVFNNNLENESKNLPLRSKKNLEQPFNSMNMSTAPFNNNINNSNYISNQQPISNQQINKNNKVNEDYSKLSVMDRMREYKNKMNNTKISIVNSHESKISNQPKNLNPFEQNYIDQEMGSNASKITLQTYNKPPPSQIENQINEMNKHPKFNLGNFDNVQPVNRNEITMIGVQPNENIERKNVEDTLLKLCADKLVQKIPTNQTLFTLEQPIPQPSINNLSPEELEKLKKERIENYILNAIKNKELKYDFPNKKIIEQKENDDNNNNKTNKNEICKIYEKEYISNTKQIENDKYEKLIESLNNKFGGIENALNNLGKNLNNQQPPQNQRPMFNNNIPNINDISSKVMHRLRNEMGIDINLNRPNNQTQETKEKTVINKKTVPFNQKIIKKKYDGNQILDETNKIKIEDLDELIRMPHKINLKEYEISQTSSYVSESQIIDINNQNNININIHKTKNINLNEESENDDSLSRGQIVNESMSANNENIKNKNRTGLDLLLLKNYNENLPNQINLMNNYKYKYENNFDDDSYKFNNNQNKNINLNVFNVDDNNFNYNDKNVKINIQNNNMEDNKIEEEKEDQKINININKNTTQNNNNNNIKSNSNSNNNVINTNKNINIEVNESDNFFENSEES